MLVELGLVEQRYQAVLEVLNDGATVTRCRSSVWGGASDGARVVAPLRGRGLGGWWIGSSKPLSCPHQMAPEVEARIVEMRREHPGWGPRTIVSLARPGGCRAVAGAVVDLSVSGPSRA